MKATEPGTKQTKRMNLNVDAKLHNAFKIAAVMEGQSMTDVLIDFIKQYVQKYYPQGIDPTKKGRR
jgi:predicted HicB family RNase H-like nuclease